MEVMRANEKKQYQRSSADWTLLFDAAFVSRAWEGCWMCYTNESGGLSGYTPVWY